MVEIQARLRANGGLQQGPYLPYLHLELSQQLHGTTLGTNHVAQYRTLRPARDEGLGERVHIDERPPTATALLFDGYERDDLVGPDVLAKSQGYYPVGNYFHLDGILTHTLTPTDIIVAVRGPKRTHRLVGEGVELRRHDRANYPLYARWYGDEEVWRLTSWMAEPMHRVAVERLFEDREASSLEDSFAIHEEGEEEPIGVISLMNISEANASADLSVIVGEAKDRDKGRCTEAIRIILRYAFEDLALNRVGLSVFEFNQAAISAYEKLGFETEGRMQRAVRRDSEYHDAILMRILASEWRRRNAL